MRTFKGVEAWVFDLDNTLYPAHSNLFAQVDERIRDYVAKLLDIPPEAANKVQKDYYQRYGTTLRGLMQERGIQPDDFLDYVHDIDHSVLAPDPELGAALERLPGRKFIFTNGSRTHAEKTAARLGVDHHFDDIFDIVSAGLLPKPNREAYDLFVKQTGVSPARAAMFEDLARNLAVPHALGMRTVLVVPQGTREVFREAWELEGDAEPHVEFVTDDLTGFVTAVAGAVKA
ncbi:pyrimidine 5'-nucleotidase [Chthonobacter rhizosphaerae]|uniref:pyrimidine 5'-nucleotidase n=1 Tax=Chthonobacter rhizosphaerae TaxID=2735553 RepID=UPI001AED1A92|nr:pyrimidine 5'-nucleotidase [Chthonobacter rhizosphaerae]